MKKKIYKTLDLLDVNSNRSRDLKGPGSHRLFKRRCPQGTLSSTSRGMSVSHGDIAGRLIWLWASNAKAQDHDRNVSPGDGTFTFNVRSLDNRNRLWAVQPGNGQHDGVY